MALDGSIDGRDRSGIRGWVRDPAHPDRPLSIVITANGILLERLVADRYRPDLQQAGIGHGRYSFEIHFDPPLRPDRDWLIHVRSELDGQDMPASPFRIAASTCWDGTTEAGIAGLLATQASDVELEARIDFLTNQRQRLLRLRSSARPVTAASIPARQPRALVVDEIVPDPGRDGGSNALVSHMGSLQRLGFSVEFAGMTMRREPACAALEAAGFVVNCMPQAASVEEVLRRDPGAYALVYLHRVATAAAYCSIARQSQPLARVIFSVADLHHLRLARQARAEQSAELMLQARQIRLQELRAAQAADVVITHSTAEAEILRRELPAVRVEVVAWSVPTRGAGTGFAERSDLGFIGCFSHAPNVAAARTLRDQIMPRVLAADPSIRCRLVGSLMPPFMHEPRPGIVAQGHVEDLGALLDGLRLTVAPLGFGAGLKCKLLESLAAGVPCVCSPVAAEGLVLPGDLARLVVSDVDAMARLIVRLHNDRAEHELLSGQARAYADRLFSTTRLDGLLAEIVRQSPPDIAAQDAVQDTDAPRSRS